MGTIVTVLVPPQHPAFDGHFPGAPLLPGVVLLDEMLRVVEEARVGGGAREAVGNAGAAAGWTIATAKFLQPVRPGDALTLEHEALANGSVRFAIRSAGRAVKLRWVRPRWKPTVTPNPVTR